MYSINISYKNALFCHARGPKDLSILTSLVFLHEASACVDHRYRVAWQMLNAHDRLPIDGGGWRLDNSTGLRMEFCLQHSVGAICGLASRSQFSERLEAGLAGGVCILREDLPILEADEIQCCAWAWFALQRALRCWPLVYSASSHCILAHVRVDAGVLQCCERACVDCVVLPRSVGCRILQSCVRACITE